MRPLSLVLLASLVGVPTLAVLLGPVFQRGLADHRPARPCDGGPGRYAATRQDGAISGILP